MTCVAGIDLGGTFVRVGVLNEQGKMLVVDQIPIHAEQGAEEGLERIAGLITTSVKTAGANHLDGIGIGATGPVDPVAGLIQNPYTLPGWENVPIVARLKEQFGVKVILENDADVAALGEFWMGAGKGVKRLFAITVGTGIGTACIIDGEIYRGLDGAHPEGGHHIVDPDGPQCYCGAKGCWESVASGSAIARQAREAVAGQPTSQLMTLAQGEVGKIDARLVAEAARQNDPLARQVMQKAAEAFCLGLVNIVTLFVPEVIVLSGGVMQSLDLFMPAIQKAIAEHNIMVPFNRVQIRPASLGYHAGLYGAAFSVLQAL